MLKVTGGAATVGVAGCIDDADGSEDEDFPSDDIRHIIPFGAGGGTDAYNRELIGHVASEFDVGFEPENIEGAASLRGVGELYNSEPDGHTIGGFNPPSTPVSWMVNEQDWDVSEFEGVAQYATTPYLVVAHESLDVEDFDDLLDRYASGDLDTLGGQEEGGVHHVAAIIMQDLYDWEWNTYVGYDGSASTAEALAGGEIDVALINDDGVQAIVDDGTVEIVGTLTSEGSETFPEAEPVTDQGYENIDYIGQIARCIYAPPDTPQDRIEIIADTIEEHMESDEFQEWAEENNQPYNFGGPDVANEVLQDAMEEVPNNVDLEEVREHSE
jgi:tripartite-type tricarboxylate transporter receptor subunit TctC